MAAIRSTQIISEKKTKISSPIYGTALILGAVQGTFQGLFKYLRIEGTEPESCDPQPGQNLRADGGGVIREGSS